MGYLPSRRIAIAATTTLLPGANVNANVSSTLVEGTGAYLGDAAPLSR